MRQIKASPNKEQWPRHSTPSLELRKRDFTIRIADWSRNRGEPAYDVEVYIGGVYDWNESKTCTKREYVTLQRAKAAAIRFAQAQTERLL